MDYRVSDKQRAFIEATADEVLFGGAAGGGKSYAQMIDALIYASKYPKSRQLILRRTLVALKKSLIPLSINLYGNKISKYRITDKQWEFRNGSIIDFGYLDTEMDVINYQSIDYDVIRFDELTHFTVFQYTYMLSRLRGTTNYPRSIKSSTNPGSIGHSWVKARFIDPAPPMKVWRYIDPDNPKDEGITRVFIPSKVEDNVALMNGDPKYINRLKNLPEKERKALLYGDWNIFDGQFFSEWEPAKHVIKPFEIPKHWRRYVSLDYGFDMFSAEFIAVDEQKRAYVYNEIYIPGLILSTAAATLRSRMDLLGGDFLVLAPPDLWNRRQETGKSAADIFAENGVPLIKTGNDRVSGWMSVREWLAMRPNEFGGTEPNLKIFNNCTEIIRTLPQLQYSKHNSADVANEPHELTHAPDALRGFATWWVHSSSVPTQKDEDVLDYEDEVSNLLGW